MKATFFGGVGVVVSVVVATGCTSTYRPRPGPRLSVVMEGGNIAYERDGQRFSHGFFGGGLVDSVQGNPQAEEAAETFHDRNVGGFVSLMAGIACLVGAGVAAGTMQEDDGLSTTGNVVVPVTGVCALGGFVTGLVLVTTAQPYQWDAINIYNDDLEARRYVPPWGPSPPWGSGRAWPGAAPLPAPVSPPLPPAPAPTPAPTGAPSSAPES